MTFNDNYNEKELDEFMKKLDKKSINVPDELEDKILGRINNIRVKRNRRYIPIKILSSCLGVLILFTVSVKVSPKFAAHASTISFLKPIVEWLNGVDKGVQTAYDNGYQKMPKVVHKEKGYTIIIDNIFMDSDRCRMTIEIKGDKIKDLLANYENPNIYLSTNCLNGNHWHSYPGMENYKYNSNSFIRDFEIRFNPVTFEQFMKSNNDKLSVFLSIKEMQSSESNDEKAIEKFDTIEIPLEKEHIKMPKKFYQGKELKFRSTNFKITDLIINPTRMNINLDVKDKPGYNFESFHNVYLKDSEGNIYAQEGLMTIFRSEGRRDKYTKGSLYFIPSIYFKDKPKDLYLCIEGLYYMKDKEKEVILNINDEYPKEKKISDQSVIFYKPTRDDNGNLVVEFDTSTDLEYLKPENKYIEGQKNFNSEEINARNRYYLGPLEGKILSRKIVGGKIIEGIEYITTKCTIQIGEKEESKFYLDGGGDYKGYLDDTKMEIKLDME
ncbi:DUF4179 domain-containing protein [Sporosalibacterium faouarense]|uniref:DUF4179 domain-containing protein n=1 Tax=Sporosalibacterium faouarense TaxID=516123 RepID=UPI00192C59D7|nr:DUF4179 domain-containing protein [Sporosalibacterium faouarense]